MSTPGRSPSTGTPLDRLAGDDVRSVVGLVEQDAHLFDTTLAENLRDRPSASATDDELRAVLDRVGLADWLGTRCPPGWRPRSGRHGRATLRAASASASRWPGHCWPTSRSWSSTSRPSTSTPRPADALTADLLDLTDGRATLLITHRLAGLESVDEILVLDARSGRRARHPRRAARPWALRGLWWEERMGSPSLCGRVPSRGTSRLHQRRREPTTVNTDLARWQFATTSIYHFLFVPVTIGLAFLVALLQTSWYRNDNPRPTAGSPGSSARSC